MVDVSHCVATATAEGGTQAGEERTDQQGDEHPQGGPGSDLGGCVSGFFGFNFGLFNSLMGLGVDLINPLLGFWLSQVGTLSDNLCQVGTVVSAQLAFIAQAANEDAGHDAVGGVFADSGATIIAKQRVDEVIRAVARTLVGVVTSGTAHGGGCT